MSLLPSRRPAPFIVQQEGTRFQLFLFPSGHRTRGGRRPISPTKRRFPNACAKVLAFAGSLRVDSHNKKLVRLAADAARAAGAEVTSLDLRNLPLPVFDEDLEKAEGLPANARRLKDLMLAHKGLLLACPDTTARSPPRSRMPSTGHRGRRRARGRWPASPARRRRLRRFAGGAGRAARAGDGALPSWATSRSWCCPAARHRQGEQEHPRRPAQGPRAEGDRCPHRLAAGAGRGTALPVSGTADGLSHLRPAADRQADAERAALPLGAVHRRSVPPIRSTYSLTIASPSPACRSSPPREGSAR